MVSARLPLASSPPCPRAHRHVLLPFPWLAPGLDSRRRSRLWGRTGGTKFSQLARLEEVDVAEAVALALFCRRDVSDVDETEFA